MPTRRVPEVTKQDGVTVINFGPDFENLDEPVLEEFREFVLEASDSADPPLLVVDLSHTKFFGSSFIELLFRVWNRLNSQDGGRFALSGLTPYGKEILEVTHLDQLWEIFETRDEAIRAFTESGD